MLIKLILRLESDMVSQIPKSNSMWHRQTVARRWGAENTKISLNSIKTQTNSKSWISLCCISTLTIYSGIQCAYFHALHFINEIKSDRELYWTSLVQHKSKHSDFTINGIVKWNLISLVASLLFKLRIIYHLPQFGLNALYAIVIHFVLFFSPRFFIL